jgi:HEAT repeat protein
VIPDLRTALTDEDWSMRNAAVKALGVLRKPELILDLRAALTDTHSDVRRAAVRALGALRDPALIPDLHTALVNRNAGVRRAAVEALGTLSDPALIPDIRPLLEDSETSVRLMTEGVLYRLGEIHRQDVLIEALTEYYESNSGWESTADALVAVSAPSAVPPLADLLRHPFGEVRRRAALVLHRMSIPEARAALDVAKEQDAENQ